MKKRVKKKNSMKKSKNIKKSKIVKKSDKKKLVTKNMTIGEVMMINPKKSAEISAILFMSGMHCAGCGVAQFETLEQGCLAHGLDKKDVDKIVNEINGVLRK